MRLDIVLDNWLLLARGALTTVLLMLVVGTVSPLLAIPLALLRNSRVRSLAIPVAVFSWFTRAVPTLVLLFFCYYGLPFFGIFLDPLPSALLALVLSATGYNVEFFRAGLRAVPKGQYEAAAALGLPASVAFRKVIFPQALRIAVPALFSNFTLNLKGTALASLVSVPELSGAVQGLISDTYRPVEFLLAAGVIYLALNSVLIALQHLVERYLDVDAAPRSTKARSSKPAVTRPKAVSAASR
ncbi:amino acid ABC transporter permease [Roseomonas elaeocarpi]|uniref:Amino acid ABC transporter permease n=1 Tax=Roseomonas elaeocarpi TaxID=907779 RepID=A0ABV6JN61_9PROT